MTTPPFSRLMRRALDTRLARLAHGQLRFIDDDGERVYRGAGADSTLAATVRVHDPRFYAEVALRGTVGAGEAYAAGHWSSDDLVALTRILVLNRDVLEALDGGLARLATPLLKLYHARRRNDRAGARRNIADHYDLGNDFFALFLDPTMMYSCALFEREDATLAEASRAKLDRVCHKLDLQPGDHIIEIGTGWGGFAIHAARNFGCRVTTTTLSRAQHELARERVRHAGLEDRVTLLRDDYRDLRGSYDKLVSIEMIEAIGHAQLPTFFRQCQDLLKPDGVMLLQCITIAERYYARALKQVDFIQRHIFPGSFIPSLAALTAAAAPTDLKLVHLEDLTPHYARTLRAWREAFMARLDEVRALGHGEDFIRLWEFYLATCEGSFAERLNGDVQILWERARSRREPLLPRFVDEGSRELVPDRD